MIIDFHTHTFPDKIAGAAIAKLEEAAFTRAWLPGTKDALQASMREAGVGCSVILPVVTAPRQTQSINDAAVRTNELFEETGLFSFGGIHPEDPDYKETLRFIADHGMKGIKLHPVYQGVQFDEQKMMNIVDYASELGLIISVHAGIDIGVEGDFSGPRQCLNVIRTVHPKKLVLAHLGGWNQFDEVEELLVGEEVWFDTAFAIGRPYREALHGKELPDLCSEEQFVRIVRNHGVQKILFATDSPWSNQKEEVERIRKMSLTDEEKSMILGENAHRLLFE